MNEEQSRLTSGDLLAIFVLLVLFVFGGCSTTHQPLATVSPSSYSNEADPNASRVAVAPSASLLLPADWPSMAALPFDEAILNSLGSLLSLVELPIPGAKQVLIVDPIIDSSSGMQSVATRRIETRLADLVRKKYPHFTIQSLARHVDQTAVLLLGTMTAVNASGHAGGRREAYRICLALADLKTRKIISQEIAKVQFKGVDPTPTRAFSEAPVWVSDEETQVYFHSCDGSKPGDSIPEKYLQSLATRALINEAGMHYEAGRYKQALDLYTQAAPAAKENELRIRNGIYLANLKLGRNDAAAAAFGEIIELGMTHDHFAMNFLFKAGSAAFPPDNKIYPIWLREIARRASHSASCLEVVGHTSPSGPEPLNERLSYQRADYIKKLLELEAKELVGRITAHGVGAKQNLIGTGRDDLSDALDRRIAFRVASCSRLDTQTAHR